MVEHLEYLSVQIKAIFFSLLFSCTWLSKCAWTQSWFYGVLLSRSVVWAYMHGCGPFGSL